MRQLLTNGSFCLNPGKVLSGRLPAPLRLSVREGLAWATIAGDENDYWLAPGDAITLPAGSHVVVETHTEALHVELVAAGRRSLRKQLIHALRAWSTQLQHQAQSAGLPWLAQLRRTRSCGAQQ